MGDPSDPRTPASAEEKADWTLRAIGWVAPSEPPRGFARRLIGAPGRWVRRQAIRAIGADFFERQQRQLEALVAKIDAVSVRCERQRAHAEDAARRAAEEWAAERQALRGAMGEIRQQLGRAVEEAIEALRQSQVETQAALDRNAADHTQMASLFEHLVPSLEQLSASMRQANERLEMLWRGADRMWGFLHEEQEMIERFTPFFDQSRGPEETIREHQRRYVPEFAGKRRVVDLGCGRGEFLELLRGAGIEAEGVDIDKTLLGVCESKGLKVTQSDLLDWIVGQEDESFDGVFCAQVVEHLPLGAVDRLVAHAARVLVPGGRLVLETLNPTNLNVFMGPYWADPGHRQPIHPWTLTVMCQTRGFMENRVVYSAPPPPETWLPVFESGDAPEQARPMLERLNRIVHQLNDSLYGPGQYAVIARRARAEELIPPGQ